jgi:hypothetical protein
MGSTITAAKEEVRYYSSKSDDKHLGVNILLKGTPYQIMRFSSWLDRISEVPKGYLTLKEISESGHELVIQHVRYAIISAGRTQGPLSADLINGKGAGVSILFNAHIPELGSHMVYNTERKLIEYTAVENLYHELAHAMHMMKGTWRYYASERQAIEEENIFRKELARMQGKPPTERVGKAGVLVNNADDAYVTSEWFGPSFLHIPEPATPAKDAYSTGIDARTKYTYPSRPRLPKTLIQPGSMPEPNS